MQVNEGSKSYIRLPKIILTIHKGPKQTIAPLRTMSSSKSSGVERPKLAHSNPTVLDNPLKRRSSVGPAPKICSLYLKLPTTLNGMLERCSNARPRNVQRYMLAFFYFFFFSSCIFCLRFFITTPNSMKPKPIFLFSQDERNGDIHSSKLHGTHNEKSNKHK